MENVDNLEELQKMIKKSGILVIDFTASWCAPCKGMKKMLKRLEKEYPEVDIAVVDIDEAEDLMAEFEVQAVPTYIVYKKGKHVLREEGTPITYKRFLKKLDL